MTLVSPGVQVTVIDESQYASNDARATIPLIVLATHQDKTTPDGTAAASFTTAAEAGELKLITSPRELAQQYGNPVFYDSNGTVQQGNELNEVGLLAAYKTLNITNRCYVIRADIDLNELAPSTIAPADDPADGLYWLDTENTEYGIFEYSEGEWVNQTPLILNNDNTESGGAPVASYGKNGDYAALVRNNSSTNGVISYWQKLSGTWVKLGSSAWDTNTPTVARSTVPFSSPSSNTITTLPTTGDTVIIDVNSAGAETVTLTNTVDGTANLLTANTLALKTVILNAATVTLGTTSGASIANATYASDTAAVTGLQVGDVMRITDTAGSDDINMQIKVVGSGFNATGLAGSFTINGVTVDLTGVTTAALLDSAIDAAFATDPQGFTVTNDASEVTLVKDTAVTGENNADQIVIDVTGVTGGNTGFSTGTTNMSITQVATSITDQVTNTDNVTGVKSGAGPYTLTIADSATGLTLANVTGTPVTDLGLASGSAVPLADIETEIEAGTTSIEVDDGAGNDVPVAGQVIRLVSSAAGNFVVGAGTANTELGLTAGTYLVSLNSIVSQINSTITFLNTTAAVDTNGGASYITVTNTDSYDMTFSGTGSTKLGLPATVSTSTLYFADHTDVPSSPEEGDVWIKTTTPNLGMNYDISYWDDSLGQWVDSDAPLYASNVAAFDGYGSDLAEGSLYIRYDDLGTGEADFRIRRFNGATEATLTETSFTGVPGSNIQISNGRASLQTVAVDDAATFVSAVNGLGQANLSASVVGSNVVITNSAGEDIVLANGTAGVATVLPSYTAGTYSNWIPLRTVGYQVSNTAPTSDPAEGTLWYDASVSTSDIDLLTNDDGSDQWITFTGDLQISATKPTTQSDGTALVAGDIWLDSSDLDNYPVLYRWDTTSGNKWILIDSTDQTTSKGIIFADARPDASSNLDPDCPNPLLYPAGMLLWNTRASSMVVKEYRANWFDDDGAGTTNYADVDYTQNTYDVGNDTFAALSSAARWVTVSGNALDGSAYMGRKAQRIMIVEAMAAALSANEDVRNIRSNFFNLMLAPGYPELIDELVTLNVDRKETAFIITDTPSRLRNNSTEVQDWATNANSAASTGEDGLTTLYTYSADYYPPLGLTTNLDGNEVAVPSSLGALYAYLYNDNIAYPWFAPAGVNRGLLSGVFASVGYLTAEEEYKAITVSEGLKDTLYVNKINPIMFSSGRGLIVNGQKTLSGSTSALDRVNVARLIVYLRYQLEILAEEFLFELNDETTRNAVQNTFDRFLADLLGLRAIYDFLVVCDETNNTPERIDRNELWIDIAIQPAKAIEFIYIPIRVKNTGEDLTA